MNSWPEPIHTIDTLDVTNKLMCFIQKSILCFISLPPKIWRPKVTSKYKTPDYADDIDDGIFDYAAFGYCVFAQISPGTMPNRMTWYNLSMIVIRLNWRKIWRLARMLMTQLGMMLSKLFRNIGTIFPKRAPVEQF